MLLAFGVVSFSRATAVYRFYSGPERLLYDWFPLLQAEAALKHGEALGREEEEAAASTTAAAAGAPREPLNVCVGKEWYRFPSSFFIDHRYARYGFIQTRSFDGALPVPFVTPALGRSSGGLLYAPRSEAARAVAREPNRFGACISGADGVNDINRAIPAQYVTDVEASCDVVFDSLSTDEAVAAAEREELHLGAFPHSMLVPEALRVALGTQLLPYHEVDVHYSLLDAARTPRWCRVLYYPFGVSQRCAAWRRLVLQGKRKPLPVGAA